jgi:hypothetical protein
MFDNKLDIKNSTLSGLPKVIFFETHNSAIVPQTLIKLAPKLKQKEYELLFCDEMPQETSLDDIIQKTENILQLYNTVNDEFTQLGFLGSSLEEATNDQIMRFTAIHIAKGGANTINFFKTHPENMSYFPIELMAQDCPEILTNDINELSKYCNGLYLTYRILAHRYRANESLLKFYKILSSLEIGYQGIDTYEDAPYKKLTSDENKKREKDMAKFLLDSANLIIGRIGLNHAKGIQTEMLKVFPKEEIESNFFFYFIHLNSFSEAENKMISESPMKIEVINAQDISCDEFVDKFYNDITEKIKPLRPDSGQEDRVEIFSFQPSNLTRPNTSSDVTAALTHDVSKIIAKTDATTAIISTVNSVTEASTTSLGAPLIKFGTFPVITNPLSVPNQNSNTISATLTGHKRKHDDIDPDDTVKPDDTAMQPKKTPKR